MLKAVHLLKTKPAVLKSSHPTSQYGKEIGDGELTAGEKVCREFQQWARWGGAAGSRELRWEDWCPKVRENQHQ